MLRLITRPLAGFALALPFLLLSLAGCDSVEDVINREVTGTVEEVGDDHLTVDANRYAVNDETEFVGFTGLDDVSVGDSVKIEYIERDDRRIAREVENASAPDDFVVTYDPEFDPDGFVDDITNPYYPLTPGTTYFYRGETDEGTETVLVEVTDETRPVAGVTTRVVRDRVFLDGELVEDTDDWFAQSAAGDVWYLGEETCEYEDGECVNTFGSWEAGVDGAEAGIVMPATPAVGQAFYQEFYEDVAEDRAEVLSTDESVTVPYGSFTGCVQTYDTTPLDPDAREHKYYCAGVGLVLEVNLVTGERVELIEVTTAP